MKIEVKNLTKEFKKITILDNINITFEENKIYGLVGRNGSGKSVFLKILCSLYTPTSGEVLYDGVDIVKEGLIPPSTRALIEKPAFLPDLSGFDNLKLLASIQNIIGDKEILDALDSVNLTKDKDKKYRYYSLGMKQKLGIAQALMEDPKVILLDEPFCALDYISKENMHQLFLDEYIKRRFTAILSTHFIDEAIELADYIHIIGKDGYYKKIKNSLKKPRYKDGKYQEFLEFIKREYV